ncbi:MAG: hypothetical protein KIS78_22950 [Labilithrix sp.]|nr:hypothetical protein [Labilithrix sp.]MCW5835278.1 hypothetical protein [Labilithrix sp.]
MSREVREIATPELVTETEVRSGRIGVRLVGSAESVTREDLAAYLKAIDGVAVETEAAEVVFDLRALEFMSAACLRAVLAWLLEGERSPRYVARFVSDAKNHWQRRSLASLASIGGERVRID